MIKSLDGMMWDGRGLALLLAGLGVFGLVGCSSSSKPGNTVTSASGGGDGSGGGKGVGLCITPQCQGSGKVAGSVAGQCFGECVGQSFASTFQQDTGWTRAGESADGAELFLAGTGVAVDGQVATVSYALYRAGNTGGPVDGHWLCAMGGTFTSEPYSSDNQLPQPFTLTGVTDLGVCHGDDASGDQLTLELMGLTSQISGSVLGQAVSLAGSGPFCSAEECDLTVNEPGPLAGSFFFTTTHTDNAVGTPVALNDAIWVAPRSLGADVLCGSASSTVTRASGADSGTAHIELRGLHALHCPGATAIDSLGGQL
ncbi:MAG TPA: hypothetical protein VGI10_18535 [Polyangiaceae bacterium]